MAVRASPKLIHNLRFLTRPLHSVATATTTTTAPPPPPPSILNLDDAETLFSSIPTSKLIRSSLNLQAAAMDRMVDLGIWIMKSSIIKTPILRDVILATIKTTFFDHFCGGETAAEAVGSIRKLHDSGLRGMMVYALEHADDNVSSDRNLQGFIDSVEATAALPPSSASFIILKITAICSMNLLRRVSDLLRWQHKNPSFHLPWKLNTFPLFSETSPLYHTLQKPEPLSPTEEQDLQLVHKRLQKLCQKCLEYNIPLSVDAEYTSIQPAIDYLTYSSAIIHNEAQMRVVYGTIQAYLKDSKERLWLAMEAAEKMGVPMGFKLVRGAYMSWEKNLALSLGYESPIHGSIRETHDCYNDCGAFMLEKITSGSGAVVIATHNVESGKLAATKARDLGIGKENENLQFAQLYGMSEALSFGLRNSGFVVSKYMPYGPIDMVIPYLLRRAEENRGVLSSSTLDRVLIRKELTRRLKAALL